MADALPWLKLETDFPESDDADLLEEILGVPRAWTHVVELWCWVGRQRPTGDVTGLPVATLAKRAGWLGDPEVFVDALRQVGLLVTVEDPGIEPRTYVGGWAKRYAAALEKRVRDKERKAAAAAEKKRKQEEAEERRRAESARKARGSDDDSATNPRGGSAEATGKSKSTEQEQDPLATQEGVQGDDAGASPKRARKAKAERDHRGMGANGVSDASPSWWPPTTLRELCEAPIDESADPPESCWKFWRRTFEAYDGIDGRPTLKDRLQEAWDFWRTDGRKTRWKTPAGFTNSLRGGPPGNRYEDARLSRERTMRAARGPTVSETPGDTRTRARVETERAHQQRNPAYVDPATLALAAIKAGAENDDPDAAAEGRALLRSRVGIRDGPDSRRVVEALTGEGSRGPQGGAREAEK